MPDPNAPHEAGLLRLNISKAMNELHWQPKWNSQKALEMTLNWYKDFIEDPYQITLKQVVEYLS